MRKIYAPKKLRSNLTQGSIISGCVASDYDGKDVFGLIITPRCDLDHNIKVSTVHYLPIVKFDDWVIIDGVKWMTDQLLKDVKEQLNSWVRQNTGIADFLSSSMATKLKMESMLLEYKFKENIKNGVDLFFDGDNTKIKSHLKKNDVYLTRLKKSLVSNSIAPFHLIEGWNGECAYHVVIMREIHQLTRDTAMKIAYGIIADEQPADFFVENSLRRPDSEKPFDVTYEILATMDSPMIEHLIQRFVNNFAKIGVEDIDLEEVKSKTIDISKL